MRDDQLLGHFDLDFLLLELSVHLLQDLFERFLVDVDLLVDKVAESNERGVDEALLKQIIFELTAAHQKALENQVETFPAMCLMQVRLERPEKCMSHNACVFQSLLEKKLRKW